MSSELSSEVEAAMLAGDEAAFLVRADQLIEAGDPRGQLIHGYFDRALRNTTPEDIDEALGHESARICASSRSSGVVHYPRSC